MTTTLAAAIDRFGVDVDDHLDRSADVPVLSSLQAQGDVIFIPRRSGKSSRPAQLVPAEGLALVSGVAGGHIHLLLAAGPVMFVPGVADGDVGLITVPDGAEAYSAHPEHGYLGLAPGIWCVRRQREQADVIRRVTD